jgi:hypothetical protein
VKLAYDVELMRPACVLIAVAMGADRSPTLRFPSERWLLAPTSGTHVYEINEVQLGRLVAMTLDNVTSSCETGSSTPTK